MKAIPCPITPEKLRNLYVEQKLTDDAIASLLGETVKRVRSWRHRFGIETILRTSRYEVPPIEGRLRSILVGSMLGDGRLSRTENASRYHENHAENQKDYLAWKVTEWGSWVSTEMKPVVWKKDEADFLGWRFHTVSHTSLNEWHALFYDASGPKRLSREVVPLVDELALAVWFMDDGSAGWWPRITFGLLSESHVIALEIFEKFSLHPRWEVHKGNTGDFIFEGEDQAHRFIDLVKLHMPECMQHKLVFGFQGPHYQVRQALTEEVLRGMVDQGKSIRGIAKDLSGSPTTVDRYLKKYGIDHSRNIGRPPK
jgi:hypothetical protein